MMTPNWKRMMIVFLCGVFLADPLTEAAPRLGRAIAVKITGDSEYYTQTHPEWRRLRMGLALTEGASSRTGTNSVSDFWLTTEAFVRLTPLTIVRFDQLREDIKGLPQPGKKPTASSSIELERGKILVRADAPTTNSSFSVTTRACLSEVQGFGAYSVWLVNNRACVRVRTDTVTVLVRGRAEPVVVQAGQQLCVDCDPRTNEAVDIRVQPTPVAEPDPDWPPNWPPPTPPGGPTTVVDPPPVYEISPTVP